MYLLGDWNQTKLICSEGHVYIANEDVVAICAGFNQINAGKNTSVQVLA